MGFEPEAFVNVPTLTKLLLACVVAAVIGVAFVETSMNVAPALLVILVGTAPSPASVIRESPVMVTIPALSHRLSSNVTLPFTVVPTFVKSRPAPVIVPPLHVSAPFSVRSPVSLIVPLEKLYSVGDRQWRRDVQRCPGHAEDAATGHGYTRAEAVRAGVQVERGVRAQGVGLRTGAPAAQLQRAVLYLDLAAACVVENDARVEERRSAAGFGVRPGVAERCAAGDRRVHGVVSPDPLIADDRATARLDRPAARPRRRLSCGIDEHAASGDRLRALIDSDSAVCVGYAPAGHRATAPRGEAADVDRITAGERAARKGQGRRGNRLPAVERERAPRHRERAGVAHGRCRREVGVA